VIGCPTHQKRPFEFIKQFLGLSNLFSGKEKRNPGALAGAAGVLFVAIENVNAHCGMKHTRPAALPQHVFGGGDAI
jgi:hypothetical protein